MGPLTSSLSWILVSAAAQAHQQLVHFVHHAHVSLVEESRVAACVEALDLRNSARSQNVLRGGWDLTGSSNVTSSNTGGEVQVERNSEAGRSTVPVVGLDWGLECIS